MNFRRLMGLFICICLLGTIFSPARAATSNEIRNEIDKLEAQEQALQEQIDALEQQRVDNLTEMQQMISQKQVLDQQIALLNQQILTVQEQLLVMKTLVADQQDACDRAAAEHAALNEKYKERIRTMEEEGQLSYWSVLFRSSSLADFLDRLTIVQEIAQADRDRLQELRQAAQKVEAEKRTLLAQQSQLQATADDLEENQQLLEQKRAESEAILRQLAARAEEFEKLLDESELAQQELLLEIARKEDEFDRAAYLEWLAAQPPILPDPEPTPTPGNPPEAGGASNPGNSADYSGWVVPVPYYRLTSPFAMRVHPIYGDYRMHNGIDMACAEGTPIYAARGGQVEIAKYSDSAGNYVQINHGSGYRSVYMHMTHYIVSPGQYVQAGQTIGYVGNTGASKGNHLHFGISLNGEYVNPYPYIAGK